VRAKSFGTNRPGSAYGPRHPRQVRDPNAEIYVARSGFETSRSPSHRDPTGVCRSTGRPTPNKSSATASGGATAAARSHWNRRGAM